ncbi:MAG: DUF4157 domain-containing protein [Cyclobacteriaceae bacterium]
MMKLTKTSDSEKSKFATGAESEKKTGALKAISDLRPMSTLQLKGFASGDEQATTVFKKNNNGLPASLKSGIENLSGYSMADVKVHYNSQKPAQLNAHAYAQGNQIHLGPRQEKHLPHEAWHVVQQKQGRVRPTMQFHGKIGINDDRGLEQEADVMGHKAAKLNSYKSEMILKKSPVLTPVPQLIKKSEGAKAGIEIETTLPVTNSKAGDMEQNKQKLRIFSILNGNDKFKESDQEILKIIIEAKYNAEVAEAVSEVFNEFTAFKFGKGTLSEKAKLAVATVFPDFNEDTEDHPVEMLFYELKKEINKSLNTDFDPGYSKLIYESNEGWAAVVDHMPLIKTEYEYGRLFSHSGVEIVTNPLKTVGEAKEVMTSIHQWLDKVVRSIRSQDSRTFTFDNFLFSMPKASEPRLMEGNMLKGNIQVSVGARLDEVIDVHKGNIRSISVKNKARKKYAQLIDEMSGNNLFEYVFAMLTGLHYYELNNDDKKYIRNISFLYLFSAFSDQIGSKDSERKSLLKNRFPILSKTSIARQIELSDWENKDLWETKKFRKALLQSIAVYLENSLMHGEYNEKIYKCLELMEDAKDPITFKDARMINDENELVIGADKNESPVYAGVFELRDVQDVVYPQNEWLAVWSDYLDFE